MSFPIKRLRRLRISEKMRELVQETTLTPKDFICPVFVQEDLKTRIKVESMSEIERLPLEDVNDEYLEFNETVRKLREDLLNYDKQEISTSRKTCGSANFG